MTAIDIIPDSVIEEALDEVIKILINKYDELGMRSSGNWAKGLEGVVENGNGVIKGFRYTEQLVFGRGPNHDQSSEAKRKWVGWAGNTFIKQWVKDKGLNLNPFAVAGKIANSGTTWYEKGGSDLLEVLNSQEAIDAFYSTIGRYLKFQIREDLKRQLKAVES